MEEEIIKPIEDFPGYFISSEGNAYSKKISNKNKSGLLMKLKHGEDTCGYFTFSPCKEGKRHTARIHLTVLKAFVGPKPASFFTIDQKTGKEKLINYVGCHINNDKHNNRADNLSWGTEEENKKQFIESNPDHAKKQIEKNKVFRELIIRLIRDGYTPEQVMLLTKLSKHKLINICEKNKNQKTINMTTIKQ